MMPCCRAWPRVMVPSVTDRAVPRCKIFDQGVGSEIYLYSVDRFPWLRGKTFAELPAHFPNAIVLGWTDLLRDDMMMNPPLDARIGRGPGDRRAQGTALSRVRALNLDKKFQMVDSQHLVLLSKTDRITCLKNPRSEASKESQEKGQAAGRAWTPFKKKLRDAHVRPAVRVVVLDDAVETAMLEDLAGLLSPRSTIVTVSKARPEPDVGSVCHTHITGSTLSLESARRAKAGDSDVVVIRCDGETESCL